MHPTSKIYPLPRTGMAMVSGMLQGKGIEGERARFILLFADSIVGGNYDKCLLRFSFNLLNINHNVK